MKQRDLWRVSVVTQPAAEDFVLQLLESRFREPGNVYQDFDTGRTTVTVYLAAPPRNWPKHKAALEEAFDAGAREGHKCAPGEISLRRVRPSEWVDSWKRHCRPFEIGRALLVKPSWSRKQPKAGQAVIVIDPGLSFGTGQHPTTRFCLEQVVARRTSKPQTFLDIGTGTGVLAMAAARVGYHPVEAFDYDPESVRVSRQNLGNNQLTNKIKVWQQDLTKWPMRGIGPRDVVCANLLANLLLEERRRLVKSVRAGGFLVLAGILEAEFSRVATAYDAAGLKLVAAETQGEWRSGCFERGLRG